MTSSHHNRPTGIEGLLDRKIRQLEITLDRQCCNDGARFRSRMYGAFIIYISSICLYTFVSYLFDGGGLYIGEVLSLIITVGGSIIFTSIPILSYAFFCAIISEHNRLLICLVKGAALCFVYSLVMVAGFGGFESYLTEAWFFGLLYFCGLVSMAGARGLEVLMMQREQHFALERELNAEKHSGIYSYIKEENKEEASLSLPPPEAADHNETQSDNTDALKESSDGA